MSIKSDAYQLCKKVWTAPSREKIREIIWSLNHATEEQIRAGEHRTSFGAAARQLHMQALGYLVVDRDKATLEKSYLPLKWFEGLNAEEKTFLQGTHKIFVELNNMCVAPFLTQFPQFTLAVNPYSRFGYEIPDDVADVNLLQSEDIENMAHSFQQHRAFQIVADSFSLVQDQLSDSSEEYFTKAIFGLEKQLLDSGPLSTQRQVSDIFFRYPPNSEQRVVYRFLAALLSIRTSLAILDELIFKAILTNHLSVLNENNIVEFGSLVSHASGKGLTILAQPNDEQGPIEIGLVLVKDRTVDIPLDLFFVEFVQFQSSQEFGDTMELHLREVNENLNRFSLLLDNV